VKGCSNIGVVHVVDKGGCVNARWVQLKVLKFSSILNWVDQEGSQLLCLEILLVGLDLVSNSEETFELSFVEDWLELLGIVMADTESIIDVYIVKCSEDLGFPFLTVSSWVVSKAELLNVQIGLSRDEAVPESHLKELDVVIESVIGDAIAYHETLEVRDPRA